VKCKVSVGLLVTLKEQWKFDISFIGKVIYFPQLQLFGKMWLVLLGKLSHVIAVMPLF